MNVGSLKRRVLLITCLALLFGAGTLSANRNGARPARPFLDCATATNDMIRDNLVALLNNPTSGVPGLGVIYEVKVRKPVARFTGKVRNSEDERSLIIIANDRAECIDSVDTSGLKVACSDAKAQFNVDKLLELMPCAIQQGDQPVRASVRNGVATLTGKVPSKRYKRAARQLVEAADCVERVINNIDVVRPDPMAEPDCNTISDAQVAAAVKKELMAHLSCAAAKYIEVTSANRVVTLRGVTLENGNYAAERIARGVKCVLRVIPMITEVAPQCGTGALSCITLDGEQWCCVGCRRCPLTY